MIAVGATQEPKLTLTSRTTYQVAGRGTVKVIANPGPDGPLGHRVRSACESGSTVNIDGEDWVITSIDLDVPPLYAARSHMRRCLDWGLVVRPPRADAMDLRARLVIEQRKLAAARELGRAPGANLGRDADWRPVTPADPPPHSPVLYLHRDCATGWPGHRRADGDWQPYDASRRPVSAVDVEAWMPLPAREARPGAEVACADVTDQAFRPSPSEKAQDDAVYTEALRRRILAAGRARGLNSEEEIAAATSGVRPVCHVEVLRRLVDAAVGMARRYGLERDVVEAVARGHREERIPDDELKSRYDSLLGWVWDLCVEADRRGAR